MPASVCRKARAGARLCPELPGQGQRAPAEAQQGKTALLGRDTSPRVEGSPLPGDIPEPSGHPCALARPRLSRGLGADHPPCARELLTGRLQEQQVMLVLQVQGKRKQNESNKTHAPENQV